MRKILFSLLTITLVAATTIGATRAYFSDTVTATGLTLATGNADLKIDVGTGFEDNFNLSFLGASEGLYPGDTDWVHAMFSNQSQSDIDLNLKAKLTAATGDWGALKDVLQLRIVDHSNTSLVYVNWKTLAEWNANPIAFGNPLEIGKDFPYRFQLRVPTGAGNEIANKTLSNITFEITAEQAH